MALLSAPVACGGAAQELATVRAQLDRVQKQHAALAKRVDELEGRTGPGAPEAVLAPATPGETPVITSAAEPEPKPLPSAEPKPLPSAEPKPLKVVKLEPKPVAAPPEPTPDDDEPRPFLKIGPSGSIEQTIPDEPTKPAKKSITSKTPVFEPQAAKDYDAAYALVKSKKPKQALDAFGAFIVRYPDHPYAANALYWRGECYFALGEFASAVTQFDALAARFPGSNKLADGLLKLGLAHKKLGSDSKARAAFVRLKKDFPTSEAAKKIPPEDAS
ncbi:MAG: tol-pal system protein YbgF [Deltaproteobacteria bacterium]|nr:tol-pal system protein YbgF [Deltaproteobacteria bacterium]